MPTLRRVAKSLIRHSLPLRSRQRIAVWASRQKWLRGQNFIAFDLLSDMAERDPDGFHRFLWSNHLAYAETYEVERRLVAEELHPTRLMLLEEVACCLREIGCSPDDVESVLDVGCSLGYVLRHLETGLLSGARRLDGIDIDEHAVASGSRYLAEQRSRVRLAVADMTELDHAFGSERYDLVLSAGVLMYAREEQAQRIVATMLRRTQRLLVLTGLAHPQTDNGELERSATRERDGTFIHNLDAMIASAGGQVVRRRWEGGRKVQGNTIYFVLAVPSRDVRHAAASNASAAEEPQQLESV